MSFVYGLLLALIIDFFFARIAERTNKQAGDACHGDCSRCSAHCVGFHCYLVRQQPLEVGEDDESLDHP